ncbi:ABC transporter substrate-binding protein [Streptococcus pneumoniae]|nr:ABC transporter substrate-binding protein [Streptococcus pneumoniae]
MIRFLVLAGYFELTIYLHLSGKLNQYINMHYSYLAYISMVLSFILAIVQLYIWMKQVKTHSHLNSRLAKMTSISLLAIPLVIGLTFPTVSLDSQTVSAKGYHFPLSEGTDLAIQTSEGTTSQYLKPDTSSYFSKSAYEKDNAERRRINTYPKIVFRSLMKTIWKSWRLSTTIQMSLRARQSSLQALSITTPVMPIVNFCSDSALSTVSQILVSMDC